MKPVLIITGGSRGIGLAACHYFLAQDWEVINLSRSQCPVDEVEQVNIDLTADNWQEMCSNFFNQRFKAQQKICLVHNAAFYHSDSILNCDEESINKALQVQCVAPLLLNQMLIEKMAKNSSILYVGSTLSEKAVAHAASYTISKHATLGLMKASCQDLMEKHIHTACVCPGFTDTDMLREHLSDEQLIAIASNNSYQRLVNPEEIAETLYFCAMNPVINGSTLHANLGQRES